MKTVSNSEYVTAIAAASVAVVIPSMTQKRMITTTNSPGSDAMNVRRTAFHPGNLSSIDLPSTLFGYPYFTACQYAAMSMQTMIQNTGTSPANIRSPIETPRMALPSIVPVAACAANA